MVSAKKYFVFLNLFLITGVVYYSVGIFYKVAGSKMDTTRTSQTIAAPGLAKSQTATSPYAHYQPIMARDLFNTAKTVDQKDTINVEALQPTQLNLKLWGTVAEENRTRAYAVIEDLQSRQQGLYRPGDAIQNAVIKLILREKVILSVDGKDEVLEMASVVVNAPPAKTRNRTAARGRSIRLERSFVNMATRDIGQLMNQVRIEQVLENGQPAGLKVTDMRPGSVFRRIGLRNGDVLIAVAGKPVQSVNDMAELYQSLKTSSRVEVQVKRRNRLQTITYDIQ